MSILGKDLIDWHRPKTHTKVQFGNDRYWVENIPRSYPYGNTLVTLLNYDAGEYFTSLDRLTQTIEKKDRAETQTAFLNVVEGFIRLPFYRLFIEDIYAIEPETAWLWREDADKLGMADSVIADDGRILNKYCQARDDIRLIQERYPWYLGELFRDQTPEKKKGQRKIPPAQLAVNRCMDAFVSGRSLGSDPEVDPPLVNMQYMIYEPAEGYAEVVEQMYFDRLLDFVYVEFMKGMQKGYIPKRCGNCGKWFLQGPGPTFSYCQDVAPDETEKTCRDIGAAASFHAKVRNNDVWNTHQRAYKKYYARVSKKAMTKPEFELWACEAERLRDTALHDYERAPVEMRESIVEKLREDLNRI